MRSISELENKLKAVAPLLESLVDDSIKMIKEDQSLEKNVLRTWEDFLAGLSTTLYQKSKASEVNFFKKISLFKLLPKG